MHSIIPEKIHVTIKKDVAKMDIVSKDFNLVDSNVR